jgi:hypothetical protein
VGCPVVVNDGEDLELRFADAPLCRQTL